MNKRLRILILSSLSLMMQAIPAFSQDDEPALPSATEAGETAPEEEISASQEVGITEDNYRQFMELKDPMRQRDVIPENVFKPGSGLQKLDKLPEESQKHLRNQLREIIVQGDPWQPGDEETIYPYTPSPAASTNPALEKQELEAWGELVESYHERESQIYENSSGMQAARGSEQGSSNSQQSGAGSSERRGQKGEGSEGQQPGQQGNADQSGSEGTYSLDGSTDSSANSTAGVSQNAMEFLRGLGQSDNGAGSASTGDSEQNDGQWESPAQQEGQSEAQLGQQSNSGQVSAPGNGTQSPTQTNPTESTAGATQNAMEFLQGNTGQAEGLAESSTGQNGGSGESDTTSSEGEQGQDGADGGDQGQAMAQDSGARGAGQQGDQEDSQDGEQAQDGQLAESSESSVSTAQSDSSNPNSPTQAEEESTAGSSQNALEYLTGENPRPIEGAVNDAGEEQPEGTLSIQDLLNAQGVGESANAAPLTTASDDESQVDEDKPEKDGGGH